MSIEGVLAAHATVATGLGEWCCKCSPLEWRPAVHRAPHVAAAIRAHLLSDEVVERAALAVATVAGLDAARDRVRAALTAATGEAP